MASWTVLGTSDEVTTCSVCGKVDLKKTVVLSNGIEEIYVGSECASRLTGSRAARINRRAANIQKAADKATSDAEWSAILHATHYNYLKNVAFSKAPDREVKIEKGFARVVAQTGLTAEVILSHLEGRWGAEVVSVLR